MIDEIDTSDIDQFQTYTGIDLSEKDFDPKWIAEFCEYFKTQIMTGDSFQDLVEKRLKEYHLIVSKQRDF